MARAGARRAPSAEVLAALARALKLDPTERRHLFQLSDRPPPEIVQPGPQTVPAPLIRMLDSMDRQPSYVVGRRWDVLAWNRAAVAVFGDYRLLPGDERNTMHMVFANPAHRRLLTDWEAVARASLAMFRADSARYAGDPDFERLIARLNAASVEFRTWWPKYEVQRPLSGVKRVDHPTAKRMSFEYTSLVVGDPPELRLVVFTPLADDDTAAKLDRLLRSA